MTTLGDTIVGIAVTSVGTPFLTTPTSKGKDSNSCLCGSGNRAPNIRSSATNLNYARK